MTLAQTLVVAWKYCLSFRKRDWDLDDYPIDILEQRTDLIIEHEGKRLVPDRYLARIVKWWVVVGSGNTKQEAMLNLAAQFEKTKADRQSRGRAMLRPGAEAPIEFAPSERIAAQWDLAEDFIRRVLGLDWAVITDGSSLWEFPGKESKAERIEKIREMYGVDVSDIESGNIADILDRIANKHDYRRPGV